jgi:hypothetical protein
MTEEKFRLEIDTLKSFFELYCANQHKNIENTHLILEYKGKKKSFDLSLCPQCLDSIKYSINKLKECPHKNKPRCRKCTSPCYEKSKWKETAKVMKYSAIKLSLGKIKSRMLGITK